LSSDTPPDLDALRRILATVVAPWVAELGLQLRAARPGEVELALPVAPKPVHGGGVLCGQSMMAAADTAMILAVCTHLGGFKPRTTVQLPTSFLRPIPGDAGTARVAARVLRMGRRLVFGEVLIHEPKGKLAAHATSTYSML
jgi:uncharacterized protein (TIGR00369 family)